MTTDNSNEGALTVTPNEADRWRFDCAYRERELALREEELKLRRNEQLLARWWNPLFVAILAATIAAGVNVYATLTNASQQRDLMTRTAESARILEMLRAPSTEKATENLKFLLDAGLVTEPTTAKNLREFLSKQQKRGEGPLLSTSGWGTTIADPSSPVDYKDIGNSSFEDIKPKNKSN